MDYLNYFNNAITILSFVVNLMFVLPCLINLYEYFSKKRYVKKVLGYSKEAVQISHCTFELEMLSGVKNNFITCSKEFISNSILIINETLFLRFCCRNKVCIYEYI